MLKSLARRFAIFQIPQYCEAEILDHQMPLKHLETHRQLQNNYQVSFIYKEIISITAS